MLLSGLGDLFADAVERPPPAPPPERSRNLSDAERQRLGLQLEAGRLRAQRGRILAKAEHSLADLEADLRQHGKLRAGDAIVGGRIRRSAFHHIRRAMFPYDSFCIIGMHEFALWVSFGCAPQAGQEGGRPH